MKICDLRMHGTTVPGTWAALEPHFPCASHWHPMHSSHGLEIYLQIVLPHKPPNSRISTRLAVAYLHNPMHLEATVLHIPTQLELRFRAVWQIHKLCIRLTVSYINQIDKSFCTILSDISRNCFWNDVCSCQPLCGGQQLFPIPSANFTQYMIQRATRISCQLVVFLFHRG